MKNYLRMTMLSAVLLLLSITAAAQNVERQLYATDFTEWDASTSGISKNLKTRFAHDPFTIVISGDVEVAPAKPINSLTGWAGFATTGKSGTIITSALPYVKTVEFTETVGRGGGNGWKLEVMGDGDQDWVTLVDGTINATTTKSATVNRTNVYLRWSNISTTKALYLTSLRIIGNVPAASVPTLNSFVMNGETITAGSLFTEQIDGSMAADIDISKLKPMIGNANHIVGIDVLAGDIKSVFYDGDATKCKATITIGNGIDNVVYVINATQKPDYTVTFANLSNGTTVGTRSVEKDAALGDLSEMLSSVAADGVVRGLYARETYTASEGQRFYYYRKVTADEIITSDNTFYVIATPNETSTIRNEYFFYDHINTAANTRFYPEDHEGIEFTGGAYHNAEHGWKFGAGNSIRLITNGNSSQINIRMCASNTADINYTTSNGKTGTIAVAGKKEDIDNAFVVEGAQWVDLQMTGDTYIHAITVTNRLDEVLKQENGYLSVAAGSAEGYLAAIEQANTNGDTRIFLPNGTYDLGKRVLTTIHSDNNSIIGESMEGTIVKNAPDVLGEGINLTATLRNYAQDLYLQDLTLQNAMDYYNSPSSAGRGVVILDQGNRTICKNVAMLSYQDTYYTKNNSAKLYWEGSEIHGTVDFICGGGDVMFKDTKIVVEPRTKNGTGACTITAPTTSTQWGYVFDGCTIDNKAQSYNLGRSWQNTPKCVYLNTKMNQQPSPRWTAAGMNGLDPKVFAEYNSTDLEGTDVTPAAGTTMKFTNKNTVLTIVLTAEEAAQYTTANIFGSWAPDAIAAQLEISDAEAAAPEAEAIYLVDGQICAGEIPAGASVVRKANARGGFGPAFNISAGISGVVTDTFSKGASYNLAGQKVNANAKGIIIINGKKVIR